YKDIKLLQQFIPERSKILPRRISGTCANHQRPLQQAIKRARHLALIPFTTDQEGSGRVILLSDQRHPGRRGEVVDVKPGYGRNFLLPQGFALEASDANI